MKVTIEINDEISKEELMDLKNKIIRLSYTYKQIKESSLSGFGHIMTIYPKNYKESFLKKIGVLK